MKSSELISSVKGKVKAIDPGAKVLLFGSRARGDQNPNSDWDFLILSSRNTTPKFKRDIRNSLVDTEFESEQVISTIIYPFEAWPNYRITPLFQNIEEIKPLEAQAEQMIKAIVYAWHAIHEWQHP